ncbi:MAG: response regulator [Desulfobacteraceae bacterium]|nr:MAG: response regulator [Desulfobacteraceae bacterium]
MKRPTYAELKNRVQELEKELRKLGRDSSAPGSQVAACDGSPNREKREEVLKASEESLSSILNAIQDAIAVLDPDLRIVLANNTMKKWFKGVLPLEGRKCFEAFHGRKAPCEQCPTLQSFRTGKQEMVEISSRSQGSGFGSYELLAFPMFDQEGGIKGVVEFARDVTARKRAQEEKARMQAKLQEAQRMQAIATLAGGIAHQFNNALASISLSIDLIRMDLPKENPMLAHIKKMKSSTERMAHLTSQLLAYAEGGRYQTRVISAHEFIRNALPAVLHDLDSSVHVDTDLPPDTMSVKADVTQMQMVLSAVVHNAAESMDSGGWIRVTTRNEIIGENSTVGQDLVPGPYVCLSIEDNGKGMDEETLKRVFEPFFTTKFHGRGLGMPAVYGIIKGHDGCVAVDSEPGKGTRVRIYIPAVETKEKKPEVREGAVLKGAGTVLLIEDEALIMDVSRKVLERIGYRVLQARSGKEALRVCASFRDNIDLALLDVILPDMGGKEIYQALMSERPGLKVLVCSGYSIDGPARDILKAGAQGFIQKPFSLLELNRMLQDLLRKP